MAPPIEPDTSSYYKILMVKDISQHNHKYTQKLNYHPTPEINMGVHVMGCSTDLGKSLI